MNMPSKMEAELFDLIESIVPEEDYDSMMIERFARRVARVARKYGATDDVLSQ